MTQAYISRSDGLIREYARHKAIMEHAAEMELAEMFKPETLVAPVHPGNRAERRRQAAQARKAKP